jgi:ABC-type multidrug transport system ATPase subunit/pSer/pThr/pTyr-binding forkhead associated (FHA) protein
VSVDGLSNTALEISVGQVRKIIPSGRRFIVGRGEEADLQVTSIRISRRHLAVHPTPQGWLLEDMSQNGCFVNGRRIDRLILSGPTVVILGAPSGAPEVKIQPVCQNAERPSGETGVAALNSFVQGKPSSIHLLRDATVRIGRAPDNDVVLGDLLVSRYHAVLTRDPNGWRVKDLGSPNGSFVNGQRINEVMIGPADLLGIGHFLFRLEGDRLVERVDSGEIDLSAHGLVVLAPDGKRILDQVGFSLEQHSLLAVVGPSGAGKSTLLRALTGFRPADHGHVTYAGRDLYADYDELRQRIGLVPQDDILHPQLSVRRALEYAARLRFPRDVATADQERRIDEVLAELGLSGQAEQRIASLSGGQRKRTSVALELLTRPSLLFLDEPTSGLDPGLDKSVMRTLRALADDGRTVVVVTHSVANLDVCDRLLLLAPGGSVAYFGPPQEALQYFDVKDFADLFLLLERTPHADWAARFRTAPQWARYVGTPANRRNHVAPPHASSGKQCIPRRPAARQQSAWTQLTILSRRYLAVIAADRQYLIFMIALPLMLSALAHALPGQRGLSLRAVGSGSPQSLLLVLIVGAALMGSAASIRELVKERAIYRRERAIGLSRGAYLWSKLLVLGAITGVQALLLGLLGNLGRPAPDKAILLGSGTAEIVVALVGVALASMAIGLLISGLIDNADRGMPLLVLLIMLQFILSSAVLQISRSPGLGQLSWLLPSRWGFALGAVTIGLDKTPPYLDHDPLWSGNAWTWTADLAILAVLAALFALGSGLLLRRLDAGRRFS